MDFPSNPAVGQEHSIGSRTWRWNGTAWLLLPAGEINRNLAELASLQPAEGDVIFYENGEWQTGRNPPDLYLDGGNF